MISNLDWRSLLQLIPLPKLLLWSHDLLWVSLSRVGCPAFILPSRRKISFNMVQKLRVLFMRLSLKIRSGFLNGFIATVGFLLPSHFVSWSLLSIASLVVFLLLNVDSSVWWLFFGGFWRCWLGMVPCSFPLWCSRLRLSLWSYLLKNHFSGSVFGWVLFVLGELVLPIFSYIYLLVISLVGCFVLFPPNRSLYYWAFYIFPLNQ